jgi:hypothetical protein
MHTSTPSGNGLARSTGLTTTDRFGGAQHLHAHVAAQ